MKLESLPNSVPPEPGLPVSFKQAPVEVFEDQTPVFYQKEVPKEPVIKYLPSLNTLPAKLP